MEIIGLSAAVNLLDEFKGLWETRNIDLRTVPTNSMVFLPRFMITQGM